jgi:drug/metabolite transporter (DMT)-like permease
MNWSRFEAIIGFVGSLLGIIAFAWQFWPLLRPKKQVSIPDNVTNVSVLRLLPRIEPKPDVGVAKGVVYAILAAIIWSFSHNTFRTAPSLACNSEIMAAFVFLGGGICVAIYCLLTDYFGGASTIAPNPTAVLSTLFSSIGVVAIILNAIEFVFYLCAMHLITAGQTMALWKTNPLWTLIILAVAFRKNIQRASIAAAFCVVAGVYFVLAPQISGPGAQWNISGSVCAFIGGATFAGYTCALHLIYQQPASSNRLFRYWLQSALLITTGVALCVYNSVIGQRSEIKIAILPIVAFNSVRIAVTYVLYSEAIALTRSPVLVAAVVCLEVPMTMAIEYFWFGSIAASNVLGGSFMIIIGILSILKENDDLWQAVRQTLPGYSAVPKQSRELEPEALSNPDGDASPSST